MNNATNNKAAPAAFLARRSLEELRRRDQLRSSLRRDGFSLTEHDEVSAELRELAAAECLKASKEARAAGCAQGAKEWADHYAEQEWRAAETRESLGRSS